MMRKHLLFYALSCFIAFGLSNCSTYDDPSGPGKSSLTVDNNGSGLTSTEFTFTVTQVAAQSISLLPEGDGKPGILIGASSFVDGKATIKYTYSDIGTFQAVVKSVNNSPDGKTIKVTVSDPVSVEVTSDQDKFTAFSFSAPSSTSTTIWDKVDTNSDTISIVLPYNPYNAKGITALKANFTASDFTTVKVGATAQTSGTTANDFTNTLTYTVTSANGLKVRTYLVTATVMPVGTIKSVKSGDGTVLTAGSFNKKKYGAFVDNTNKTISVILPNEASDADLASVQIGYELTDSTSRAVVKQNGVAATKNTIDLTGAKVGTLEVTAQDLSVATYTIYGVVAPQFDITITNLTPNAPGTRSGFGITINVLKGTDLTDLDFTYTKGSSVTGVKYKNAAFASGTSVDYSVTSPQNFVLAVTDAKGVDYEVTYSVDVLKVP